jgi:hypothetical protein
MCGESKSKKKVVSSGSEINPVTKEVTYFVNYSDGSSESGKVTVGRSLAASKIDRRHERKKDEGNNEQNE